MADPRRACRKMRGLVTTKKLRDIAAAQRRELAAMGATLDRLYMRSFPSFMHAGAPHAKQPDEA